jgi:hypothetical protein
VARIGSPLTSFAAANAQRADKLGESDHYTDFGWHPLRHAAQFGNGYRRPAATIHRS